MEFSTELIHNQKNKTLNSRFVSDLYIYEITANSISWEWTTNNRNSQRDKHDFTQEKNKTR
jgi:uncharacterized membrane protein